MAAPHDWQRDLRYIADLFAAEDGALDKAYGDARAVPGRPSVSAAAGKALLLLTRAIGAGRALEIGAGAGYSGIWIARGLAPGGRLQTLEVSEQNAAACRENYAAAGVDDRIEILIGAALDVLPTLDPPYDLCFIDAVKREYPAYLDHALRLVQPGGLILADNVLWSGRVSDPDQHDDDTVAIREFNQRLAEDDRLASLVLPLGDGLSVSLVTAGR